jgi:hypothetical protein
MNIKKGTIILNQGDIEALNSSDIEEKLIAGEHLSHKALTYAVEQLGFDLVDIRFYPATDSWGF